MKRSLHISVDVGDAFQFDAYVSGLEVRLGATHIRCCDLTHLDGRAENCIDRSAGFLKDCLCVKFVG
jgi:hypothetical protein